MLSLKKYSQDILKEQKFQASFTFVKLLQQAQLSSVKAQFS